MRRQNQYHDKGYSTKRNPYQNSNDILHKDRKINPKVLKEAQKTSTSQRNLEQKQNAGTITILDFKLYYSHSCKNSLVLAQEQEQRLMEQNEIPRNKSTHLQPSDFLQRSPKHTLEKRQPVQQMVLGKLDIDMQNTEMRSLSFTLYPSIHNGSKTLM
jgi:hypothetical protein